MPCDTIRTVEVQFGAANRNTLFETLKEMGLNPVIREHLVRFGANESESIDTKTGEAQFAPGRQVAEIKRAMSNYIVKQTAKRFGWQLKQAGTNKFQTIKR